MTQQQYPSCYFIMDGKPIIKIMNKIQLLTSLKTSNSQSRTKSRTKNKNSANYRASSPLVSASISMKRKNNSKPSTLRKFQDNFLTSNIHLQAVTSCKRIFQCNTIMARPLIKKEDPLQKTQSQKLLCKNSGKIQKLLWNQPQYSLPPLIISANFIIDQDQFWSAPEVNPSINKAWKEIHRNYFVIWVIRVQKNFKKIKEYTDQFQLPLNAVYYHKKQSKYTADFSPLRKQLVKFYGSDLSEIRLIENLKLNTSDSYERGAFRCKIPVMFDERLKVYYVRNQQNGQGLQVINDMCKSFSNSKKGKVVQLTSVKNFVEDHFQNLLEGLEQKNFSEITRRATVQQKCQTEWIDDELAQKEVENFRKQLIDQIIRQKGRNFQFEGFSVHYFVGDIVKRNYDLLLSSAGKRLQNKFFERTDSNRKAKGIREEKELGIVQRFYQYYK